MINTVIRHCFSFHISGFSV